jgi:toxin-antitoxin system PIN domain toxin
MSRKPTALLDVNLLVALFDGDHVHHELAHDWFADNRAGGWATCPVTENGLVRVLTNPKYGSPESAVPAIVDRLRRFRESGNHEFWADEVSLADTALFNPSFVRGHRQITDVYLLGLARHKGARLATFDRSIPLTAVRGASRETLQIVGPVDND